MQRLITAALVLTLGALMLSLRSDAQDSPQDSAKQDSVTTDRDTTAQAKAAEPIVPEVSKEPDMQERMMILAGGLTILGGFAFLLFLRRREMDRDADLI
jgi:hypothetical protein